jgi:hypothetical protein
MTPVTASLAHVRSRLASTRADLASALKGLESAAMNELDNLEKSGTLWSVSSLADRVAKVAALEAVLRELTEVEKVLAYEPKES